MSTRLSHYVLQQRKSEIDEEKTIHGMVCTLKDCLFCIEPSKTAGKEVNWE